jgi:hypothetical protein
MDWSQIYILALAEISRGLARKIARSAQYFQLGCMISAA